MSKLTIKEKNPYSVRLARTRDVEEVNAKTIFIVPSYSTWNNFGYRIRAEIGIPTSEGVREWLDAFFALKGQDNFATFVKEHLPDKSMTLALEELSLPFASMLIESKSYSLVRRLVGAEEGRRLLIAINDISVLHFEDNEVPNWPDFFTSDIFTHAITRSSEGHFAFRNGYLVLGGRRTSGVDARQAISVDLTRQGPNLHFDFRFDVNNVLRGRIAVIIGKNGCGKTTSLARLAAGLATDKHQGVVFSRRPDVNQVLAFAHSGAQRLFKRRRDRPGATSVRTFALDPATAIRSATQEKHTRLLVDIARADDGDFRPLEYLKKLVDVEFNGLVMCIPIRAEGDFDQPIDYEDAKGLQYVELRSWPRGGEGRRLTAIGHVDHERDLVFLDAKRRTRALSLGQRAFLNFALSALANAGPASVLLIDEPENFLHPNLISRFMRVLHHVVEGTRSIAILATHSPFVVREVQSAQVHVLRTNIEGNSTEVVHPRLQTLGANVASIANEVFSDDLPEHLYELVLSESNIMDIPFDVALEQFAGELSTEALMHLRRRGRSQSGGGDE